MKRIFVPLILLALLLAIVSYVKLRGANISQPIIYNHNKHIEDVGLSCVDCHQYVESLPVAGLPRLQKCLECHEEALTESPEEEKLLEFANNGRELNWYRIYTMPEDVYFSHRRHVTIAQIECEKCHGKMEELTAPPKKPAVNLTMKFCMNCHEKMKAELDCIACHK